MEDKELSKLIKTKYEAIKENLLETPKVEEIKVALENFLDEKLIGEDLLSLRYKKFCSGAIKRPGLWSVGSTNYPMNGLEYLNNWLSFFEQYLENKRVKNRLEDENLWVQSHVENGEEHLLIGDKADNSGQHVHVIRGKTGELRIDGKDLGPQYLVSKIESTLEVTLASGKKVTSVNGMLRFNKEGE